MQVNILREIPWFGGNYFHPLYYDEQVFRMESCLRAGKSVPPHYHRYFDEHWLVKQGNPTFAEGSKRVTCKPGDTFISLKNTVHTIENKGTEDVVLITEMHPCADMHKMMAIIAGLQDEGEKNWMFKYLYAEKKSGLKQFSQPAGGMVGFITAVMMPIIMIAGKLSGWDKFVNRYSPA